MNKTNLVNAVSNSVENMTKKNAGEAVDVIFEAISNALADRDKVQLPGFGTFMVAARAERTGRNPQTGAPLTIPASNGVKFKAGKALKDRVNQ